MVHILVSEYSLFKFGEISSEKPFTNLKIRKFQYGVAPHCLFHKYLRADNIGNMEITAAAKVNLQLRVGGLRQDGYHELATVFQAISVFDRITIKSLPELKQENPVPLIKADEIGGEKIEIPNQGNFPWQISVTGPQAKLVPTDHRNLVSKVAARLAGIGKISMPQQAIKIFIDKDIPVTGGMAGGSADAAAALLGLNHYWKLGLSLPELLQMATEFGADVPFGLIGETAIADNRGDRLSVIPVTGEYHWLLVFADAELSTPKVFAEYDRLFPNPPVPQVDKALLSALAQGDIAAVGKNLKNDLEPAAISLLPQLARVLELGKNNGALGAMVSGSGPTLAFLLPSPKSVKDEGNAETLMQALAKDPWPRKIVTAKGPVSGARFS